MPKQNIVISLLLAGTLTVSTAFLPVGTISSVEAAKSITDLKKDLAEREKKQQNVASEKKAKQSELNGTLAKKTELEEQISVLQDDIDDIDSVISDKTAEIKNKETEIVSLTTQIAQNDAKLKERMKVVYENGSVSYLDMILEAKGLSDLFTRISVVRDIMTHDKNLIESFVNARKQVESAKKTVETERAESEEAKGILLGKKTDLSSKQREKEQLVSELNHDIEALEKLEQEGDKQKEQVMNELNAALKELQAKEAKEAAEKAAAAKKAKESGAKTSDAESGSNTPAKASGGAFCWPSASSTRVTSQYGTRTHPITGGKKFHKGLDIGAPQGTNVLAAADGTVVTAGWNAGGYGYYITISHGGGLVTLYGHNSKLLVSAGDKVTKGQVIAKVGSTGNSTGPHIHFEVMENGNDVNPYNYL